VSELRAVWRSADRFTTQVSGISSRHILSFGPHYDAARISIGPLVAHNDETVAPGAGFPEHRHHDVEIVTWVVSGALRHVDSTGGSGVIRPGTAQLLTAGSGVFHSEANDETSTDGEPVRFIQMWLRPVDADVTPAYDEAQVDERAMRESFAIVASGAAPHGEGGVLPLSRPDATLLVARFGRADERVVPALGLLHIFVVDGRVELDSDVHLDTGDSAAVAVGVDEELALRAVDDSDLLVWAFASAGR
jgi:redox-sensitive bicupin YhaK (pirin superfamily)